MGNPLFNEVLVALKDKDNYNRASPTADSAMFATTRSTRSALLINVVFGTGLSHPGVRPPAVYIPDYFVWTSHAAVRVVASRL